MDLKLSFSQIKEKLAQDPISSHLIKKVSSYFLIALVSVATVGFLVNLIYAKAYSMDKLLTEKDKEVLAETNAEIDETLKLVNKQTENTVQVPRSFGEEVQVDTVYKENPFVPLVKPKSEETIPKEEPELPQPSPEDQLRLEGIAEVGNRYLIIIADANGSSQVLSRGEEFNGWQVRTIEASRVKLVKGRQSLVLAWEGK